MIGIEMGGGGAGFGTGKPRLSKTIVSMRALSSSVVGSSLAGGRFKVRSSCVSSSGLVTVIWTS